MERVCASSTEYATPQDVIIGAKAGTEEAWRLLFNLHYRRIYGLMRARVSSAEEAEDLTADAFLEAFHSINEFNWRGQPFEAWLLGIARHHLESYDRALPATPAPTNGAARDEFIDVKSHERSHDILDSLPTAYRALDL